MALYASGYQPLPPPPPKKTTPLFPAKSSPLNLQTVQAPLFKQSPPPPKSRIFQWMPKILKFFILNPIF